jgi:hypothetical protein
MASSAASLAPSQGALGGLSPGSMYDQSATAAPHVNVPLDDSHERRFLLAEGVGVRLHRPCDLLALHFHLGS